jgi:hypothetical protein
VENHWRWTKNNRNYCILAVQYGDFEPEEGSYDALIKMKGFKWTIAKELQNQIDFTKFDYIGFYDDDVILDNISMSRSFALAKERDFKAFQISLDTGSESQYPATRKLEGMKYTYTNFIEIMCPVFHNSVIAKYMDLLNSYDVYTGWGVDYVLAEFLQIKPAVIHEVTMLHPSRPNTGSGYDKSAAFKEMSDFLNIHYPNIMKKYGQEIKVDYNNFRDLTLEYAM